MIVGRVGDARHDVGAGEALRVLERLRGAHRTALQIEQANDHRGRAHIDGQAVESASRPVDGHAVQEHDLAVAAHRGVERHLLTQGG